jgi:hypothetical protein
MRSGSISTSTGSEIAVDEHRIKNYFLKQAYALIERSAGEGEGFLSYFTEHMARDEEILGLIAVSTMLSGQKRLSDRFPSPAEALAALSPESRSEICRLFRSRLKTPQQHHLTAA